MKSYREVTNDLISRRKVYLRKKNAIVRKTVTAVAVVLVCGAFCSGAWLWGSKMMDPNEPIVYNTEAESGYTSTDTATPEDAPADTTEMTADEYNIIEIPLLTGMGGQYTIDSSKLPDVLFDITNIKDSYPVYICKYPIDQFAGFLFEIGEPELEIMREHIERIVKLLYGEEMLEEIEFDHTYDHEMTYLMTAYVNDIKFISSVNGVMIEIEDYTLSEDDVLHGYKENTYISAAIGYLGLKDPQISDASGESHDTIEQYDIYESTNGEFDVLTSSYFNNITVTVYSDLEQVQISVWDVDLDDEDTVIKDSIPFDEVQNYVLEKYTDASTEKIKANIVYSTYAVPGYYVPCYRLYIGSKDEGDTKYTVTDIVAVDFDLDENGDIIK